MDDIEEISDIEEIELSPDDIEEVLDTENDSHVFKTGEMSIPDENHKTEEVSQGPSNVAVSNESSSISNESKSPDKNKKSWFSKFFGGDKE